MTTSRIIAACLTLAAINLHKMLNSELAWVSNTDNMDVEWRNF